MITKQVQTVYVTEDETSFETRAEAILYENPNTCICPKCKGEGEIKEKYNAYPAGFPDSDWTYKEGVRDIICPLCKGKGHNELGFVTQKQYAYVRAEK